MEWYFAAKTGKSFVSEENFRSNRNCLEIILSPFHCFPTFFNLVRKQTYLMLIITTHAFLAVLCLSLVNGYRREQTEVRDYQPLYNYTETRHYPIGYMDLDQINNIKPTIDHFGGPTPPPSARFSKYTISPHFYAPTEIPIPFILTCVGLILSFMDLYSRAIRSQSVPNHNDITIPDNNAITTPLHIHDGITKIEDLPIVVAHPHNFTPLKNCI
uniref:Uncharacterized protein n=1 Tax=Panagrolaimus davidi TaxID=227884 RepID=A0A914R9V9_9BILA